MEARKMKDRDEMLALADEIERAAKQHEFDRRVATYSALAAVLTRRSALIVSALRAAAASAEPVAKSREFYERASRKYLVDQAVRVEQALRERDEDNARLSRLLSSHPAPVPGSVREAPTIDDVPSCGQENDFRRAR